MSDPESRRTPRGPVTPRIPEGDDRERMVCLDCGFIDYQNPRIIAGAVCTWEDKILFCRRAIEPRRGYWTIPAGFLELRESISEGAAREVFEEAGAEVEIGDLLGLFEIPRISQIYAIYTARMLHPGLDPGPESLEAALFSAAEIPWDDLAFPSVAWALDLFQKRAGPTFEVYP